MSQSIKQVAVIGAGTMGLGIAQVAAMAGYRTGLYDARPQAVDQALQRITAKTCRLSRSYLPAWKNACRPRPCSAPIPHQYPSPDWQPACNTPAALWVCIFSTPPTS